MTARRPDRTGTVEVQLDEDGVPVRAVGMDEPRAGATARSGVRPPAPSTRSRRRRRWLPAGVVLVLLVGGVALVVDRLDARRDADRLAALAAVPFVLEPLDAGLGELWRVSAEHLVGELGDMLVLAVQDGLIGVDAATGQRLWERRTGTESCEPLAETPFGPDHRELVAGAERLLCVRAQRVGTANESTTAVLVDPRTGRDGPSILMGGSAIAQVVVGDEVVLVNERARGVVEVVRWDPVTGGARWRTRSEPDVLLDGYETYWWDEYVFGITGGNGTFAVSLETGERVPAGPEDAVVLREEVTLPDGGRAVWKHPFSASVRPPGGQVVGADGEHRYDLPGRPFAPLVDDGSAPDVLLVEAPPSGIAGLDAVTGQERWETIMKAPSGSPVLRVGAVVVVRADGSSVALDPRTGEVLWEVAHRGDDLSRAAGLTDGLVVLLWHQDDGAGSLVAHDLQDGTEAWRVGLPPGARVAAATPAGRLVVTGRGWVSVLG